MRDASPLRYPGGKAALADLIVQIRKLNQVSDRPVAEPFAGGAGASLSLLYLEETPEIYVNDADPAIYDFWWSLLNRPDQFIDRLASTPVSIHEWKSQQRTYRQRSRQSRLLRGFAAFYLNRTNHSGIIINGGPIGGIRQNGNWRLTARYNKVTLARRCRRVSEYGDRIRLSCLDGIAFLDHLDSRSTFFFIDPPYLRKGGTLYMDVPDLEYHHSLALKLKTLRDAAWVLTYNDCPEIRSFYRPWAKIRPFHLGYAAASRRMGSEVLIVPRWMRLPVRQKSAAISW